ncbi:jg377, partial [Pararge aegeria aegeria]
YNRVLPCTFTTEENELNDTARTALLRERLAACRNFGAGARTMEFPRNVSIRQVRPTFPRGPPRGRFSRMRASKRFPSSGYYRPAYGLRQPRAPPPFTARPRMQPPGSRDFQNPRYRQPYHSQDQYRWVNPNVQEQYRPRHPHHWSNRSQNPHNRKGPRKE